MTGFCKHISPLLLIFYIAGCAFENNSKSEEEGFEYIYNCGAEEVDNASSSFPEASGKSITFGNVNALTDKAAHTGNYSLMLTREVQYGFNTEFTVGPDEYVEVTAWRKCKRNGGAIAVGLNGELYAASRKYIEENEEGWQKVFIDFYTPPHLEENNLNIFVWNIDEDTVYFDDIRIVHRNKKKYPQYDIYTALNIYTDDENLKYLNDKRLEAFKTKVLVNDEEDYSSAVMFDGQEFLNGEIRLKGDLLDHIQGDKWSFRVKLKSEFAWNHVRTFSVHNPATRYFLHEWLAHRIFATEDVLTTRYGFTPVIVNNQSRGIYAWEEHFEKHLVENMNRREGVIVRFDETLFWNRILEQNKSGNLYDIDYFGAAEITPFKDGSVMADSMKLLQTEEARKLMQQYKRFSAPVSEIFDVDLLARYYALMDITQAYHGFTWHNQRFYFNPVTCLLEPIAFDGYTEGGIFKRINEPVISLLDPVKIDSLYNEELLLYQVFADTVFNSRYLNYLKKYSDEEYIEGMIAKLRPESDSLTVLIQMEFPYYSFDFEFIRQQASVVNENIESIEANLPKLGKAFKNINRNKFLKTYTSGVSSNLTPLLVHAFYDKSTGKIDVLNYHAAEVSLIGTLMINDLPEDFNSGMALKAYDGLNPYRITLNLSGVPYKLIFSVDGDVMETEVSQWSYDENESFRQQLQKSNENAELSWQGDSLVFDGSYTYSKDVFIPGDKHVVLKAGTRINLTNGAGFFSFSAFHAEGTERNRVEIFSGDQNSQGFHVLQAAERSQFNHTRFYQLGNIRKGGWQTPSAVTFYEADVDFYYCTFEKNIDCDDALNTVRSDFYAESCVFLNTFADGFDSDFCTGKVVNSRFNYIGNDAIDFSGSQVTITGCEMTDVNDKAVSGGEHSKLLVEDCKIERATIGVASKDSSFVEVNNIEMFKAVYGFVTFIKKPEYGPASIVADNISMKRVMVFHQIEEGSVLTVNDQAIHGRERNLALKLYQ